MTLYRAVKDLWNDDRESMSQGWAKAARKAELSVETAGKKFNEWEPLRFYVALGNLGSKTKRVFSLRFNGQQVARLEVDVTASDAKPELVVTQKNAETNLCYFKIDSPPGRFEWRGKEAARFRASFKELVSSQRGFRVRFPEHAIESKILKEMERRSGATKFAGTLKNIRHCGYTKYDYPFQTPVPISANKGKPGERKGNMDILARRGPGRLAIWELKAPGEIQHVVQQVYIYSVVTALMLRGRGGLDWWRIFGFGSDLPKVLKIEAVVVVTKDQREAVAEQAKELLAHDLLVLAKERTELSLGAAFYDPKTLAIEYTPLPG